MSAIARPIRRTLLAGAAALAVAPPARAQSRWPDRTLKLVVPYPPGGNADSIGRWAAEKLAAGLGQGGFHVGVAPVEREADLHQKLADFVGRFLWRVWIVQVQRYNLAGSHRQARAFPLTDDASADPALARGLA